MASKTSRRAGLVSYKSLQPQQLRMLVEVAKAGSQAGAARNLQVSQPTVWEHLRALERHLDVPLLTVTGRTCTLTPEGEQLVQMALPLLEQFDSLKQRLKERARRNQRVLRIIGSPRVMHEDLAPSLHDFERLYPDVVYSLLECDDYLVTREILEHRADIGWTPAIPQGDETRFLDIIGSYDVGNYLITPPDHPLARRASIRPEDILKYRVLNGHGTFYGPRMGAIETQVAASPANRCRVAGYYVFTIRMLVKLGLGVAVVPRRASRGSDSDLSERDMSKYLGHSTINAVQRRGADDSLIGEFCRFICQRVNAADRGTSARAPTRSRRVSRRSHSDASKRRT